MPAEISEGSLPSIAEAHSPLEPFRPLSLPKRKLWIPIEVYEPAADQPLRFSLRELFLVMTAAGVVFGLFRLLGIFGAVLAFIATFLFTYVGTPRLYPGNKTRQLQVFDAMWGLVFPFICLVFDPFVFKTTRDFFLADTTASFSIVGRIEPQGWIAYPVLLCQMLALAWCLVCGPGKGSSASWLAGTLAAGQTIALVIATLLAPAAAIGTFALGIGLLGFTPWLTAIAFYHQAERAAIQSGLESSQKHLITALGAVTAVVVPGVVGYTLAMLLSR